MILESVRLQNIRSYLNETVRFPEGTVLISGDIGCGKSTILLAIEFALFGILRGSLDGSNLLRNGKSTGSVELFLAIEGKKVIIKRNLKRQNGEVRQDNGYIVVDGIKTDGTAIELKSTVLDLLGYPPGLITKSKALIYRYTVYTPQEEMKKILFDDKEARLDVLRRVFAIDKYKRIRENSQFVIKEIKDRLKLLNGLIEGSAAKESRHEKLLKDAESLTKSISELEPKLASAKKALQDCTEFVDQLEVKKARHSELATAIKVNESKLKASQDSMQKLSSRQTKLAADIAEIENSAKQYASEEVADSQQIRKQAAEMEAEYTILVQKHARAKEHISSITERLAEYSLELEQLTECRKRIEARGAKAAAIQHQISGKPTLTKELESLRSSVSKLEQDIASRRALENESRQLVSQVSSLVKCPLCLQEVNSGHKHTITANEQEKMSLLGKELSTLEPELASQKKRLGSCQQELESLQKQELELRAISAEINALSQEQQRLEQNQQLTNQLKEQLATQESEAKALAAKIASRELELAAIKKSLEKLTEQEARARERKMLLARLAEMQKELQDAKQEQGSISAECKKLEVMLIEARQQLVLYASLEQDHASAKKALAEARQSEQQLLLSQAKLMQEQKALGEAISEQKKELDAIKITKGSISHDQKLLHWMDSFFVPLVASIERQVMLGVYREFNEFFQQWFELLIEDENVNARLDDDFTPVIEQNGYETSIENLSGGEKTSCALAYRLALNKVINDMISSVKTKDVIILDEPTDGFSTEQLEKVRDVIDQLGMRQIILVSHEAKIESFVQNVIRISKQEHTSRVLS